jgi:hypothetical protein
VDLNRDGKMDLLTGSFDGGMYYLEGLDSFSFAEPKPVLDREGARILIGHYWDYEGREWTDLESSRFPGEHAVSAATVDWDGDGDLDLLLGARSGKLFLRINEGSPERTEFATHNVQAKIGDRDVMIPGRDLMIAVADWDGDGLWDIVGGNSAGEVYWLRNKGDKGKPMFDEAEKLVNAPAERTSSGKDTVQPGSRVQVAVGDHNVDGLPDLLLGDYHSQTVKGTEFTPETRERYNELIKEYRELSEKLAAVAEKDGGGDDGGENKGAGGDSSASGRAKLEARRDELMKEMSSVRPKTSRHGWVWLFERRK